MLTLAEYNLLMEAVELKEVDRRYHIHLLAFNNFRVKAKKKVGKNKMRPVYTSFRKFFDYEQELNKIKSKKNTRFDKLKRYIKKRGGKNV